jgi:hypothetical protein
VVLIPIGCLSGLSPIQVEAILLHELAHIRRYDYVVNVLQSVVEALFFYHPAVWWISRHIRLERELCCDDLAVKYTGDALTYARALSLLEERRASLPTITLAANGGMLTMRIKRLLNHKLSPAPSQLASLTFVGIVIGATAICIGALVHAQSNKTQNIVILPTTPIARATSNFNEPIRIPAHKTKPFQRASAHSNSDRIDEITPTWQQGAQTLCAPKLIGNQSVRSESVLGRLLSKQGEQFDPRLVEQDMNMLFNTEYFDEVRIERIDTVQCVQLSVYVREKAILEGR